MAKSRTSLDHKIVDRSIADLKPHKTNARTHSPAQIVQIADSIEKFGFLNPVLVDSDGRIIAGHGRIAAAKKLGFQTIPTICIDGMNEADRRAYIIADNRLAELAGWDDEILKLEFAGILELDASFDLEVTGFSETQVLNLVTDGSADEADQNISKIDDSKPPITKLGDIWQLGDHRLICGDARDPAVYDLLMDGSRAQMIFTDPPYNVPIDGHVCGLGSVKHEDFAMAAGEMSAAEFTKFLSDTFEQMARTSTDGAIHYICMDWRHISEIMAAGNKHYTELKNLIIWNKDNGGMGSFYRSKHELIFAFKNGSGKHINNFGLGDTGRYRTNVWDYAGVNSMHEGRAEELAMHPTVKPVAMIADAILDCSKRGGLILDPFCGSGSTIIAAEQTKRKAFAIELDPKYCDVTIKRWQSQTGCDAVLSGLDSTFAGIASPRD